MASFGTRAPRRVTGNRNRRGGRLSKNEGVIPDLPDDVLGMIFSETEKYGCTDINVEFSIFPGNGPNRPVGGWGNIELK